MEITLAKKNSATFEFPNKKTLEIEKNSTNISFSFSKMPEDEIVSSNRNSFEIKKLPNEVITIEDLWKSLALDFIGQPILLQENLDFEIYQYQNTSGIYYRKLDYILNKDIFYQKYENGVLSEKIAERNF